MSAAAEAGNDDEADDGADVADMLGWLAVAEAGDGAAAELAGELAAELEELRPELVGQFAAAAEPTGLLAVLDRVSPDALAGVAAALAAGFPGAATEPGRGGVLGLAAAAATRDAARAGEAAEVLAPGGVASTLLVVAGRDLAFLEALAERVGAVGLAAACAGAVVPSAVTRSLAALHDAALRFGQADALALVDAQFGQRLLGPFLPAGAAEPPPPGFAEQLVAAGRQAEELAADGDDPDDPAAQRAGFLLDAETVHLGFRTPTPADPLGTEPVIAVTAFGQAIRRARAGRGDGYDWAAVQAFAAENPDGHGALLLDERLTVLDLAAAAAGIALSEEG